MWETHHIVPRDDVISGNSESFQHLPFSSTTAIIARSIRRKFSKSSFAFFLLLGTYILLSVWSYTIAVHHQSDLPPDDIVVVPFGIPRTSYFAKLQSRPLQVPARDPSNSNSSRNSTAETTTTTNRVAGGENVSTILLEGGTLVIQVRGEMGNHLQKIAHGHALQWYAQEDCGFSPQLLVRHLKKPKWKIARADIYQCFPQLRQLDYEAALLPAFRRIQKDHAPWLAQQKPSRWAEDLMHVKDETRGNISMGLEAMKHLTTMASSSQRSGNAHQKHYPIVILGGPMRNALVDKYYQRFRDELFLFDDNNCCAQLPEKDEVVFHFRNFAKELSIEEQQSRGFEELDPQRVASQLMGHLRSGQKIAMTTRFADEPIVQEYQRAMQERGFQVRVVSNQTGVQDFCFLLRAQQELLGVAKSTYARWAAYLGDAERVQLYALENVGSQEFIRQTMEFPWTNPEINRRIHFPVFSSLSTTTMMT